MGVGKVIGPVQVGLKKPIYFTGASASVEEIIDLATLAALDAIISSRN